MERVIGNELTFTEFVMRWTPMVPKIVEQPSEKDQVRIAIKNLYPSNTKYVLMD